MNDKSALQGRIGTRLRGLRVERGLSLRALARRTGLSASFISQVESESASISIGSLQTIVTELGASLSQFFSEVESTPRVIVRRGERARFASEWSQSVIEMLTDGGSQRKISALELTALPGAKSGTRIPSRRHDTLMMVQAGMVLLKAASGEAVLEAGDAAYVMEGTSLAWENCGTIPATMLLVMASGQVGALSDIVSDA